MANIRIADNKAYTNAQGRKTRVTLSTTSSCGTRVADALVGTAGKGDLVKFKVNVQPNSYLSEKRQEVINELLMTASRFKIVRQSRANSSR